VADLEPVGPSPSQLERETQTLRTRAGAGPNLGRKRTPTQGYTTSVTRARDAEARTAVRWEAASKDSGLKLWLT
jgi:hypothetical protein